MEIEHPTITLNPFFESTLLSTWFVEPGTEEYKKMYKDLSPMAAERLDEVISAARKVGKVALDSPEFNPKGKKSGIIVIANESWGISPTAIVIGDPEASAEDPTFGDLKNKYTLYALGKLYFTQVSPWLDSRSNPLSEWLGKDEPWSINDDPIPAGGLNHLSGWKIAVSAFPPDVDESISLNIMEVTGILKLNAAKKWAEKLSNSECFNKLNLALH